MMFSYAKHVEAHLVSEDDCFEQLAKMFCRVDCPIRDRVNGCRDETIYPNLHMFLVHLFTLRHAAARGLRRQSGRSGKRRSRASLRPSPEADRLEPSTCERAEC